jgi:hypothetical protein
MPPSAMRPQQFQTVPDSPIAVIKWYPNVQHSYQHLHGDAVLLVDINDELHLVVGAEEDSAAVVDALGDDVEHACHVAVDCLAAGYRKRKSVSRTCM